LNRRGAAEEPSPDEIKRREIEFEVRAINQELRKADASEVRFLGKMQAIDCKGGKISYMVASDTETFTLTSKDFQGVNLSTYVAEAGDAQLGCDLKVKPLKAVLTYKPAAGTRGPMRGELVSVEFVPDHFRLMDGAEQQAAAETGRASATVVEDPTPNVFTVAGRPNAAPQDLDEQRRKAVLDQIRLSLRQTAPGEVRVMGFIDKSECGPKGAFFFIRSGQQVLKLNASQDVTRPEMKAFTPEIENLQIGCGMKAVDIPVLATYRDGFDKKTKANGILVALEFVPKSFVLEP
jgi:hypothetical protein